MTKHNWQWPCIAAVVGAFALSFFLPVCVRPFGSGGECVFGWEACYLWALIVLIAATSGKATPTFDFCLFLCGGLPNLLFPFGVALLAARRHKSALTLGIAASIGAWIWLRDLQHGLYSGYFVWLASMVLLAVTSGCFALLASRRKTQQWAMSPSAFFDPSVFALFIQRQTRVPVSTDVHSGVPHKNRSSSLQPPCSPSS
jgi:hypothetical protein